MVLSAFRYEDIRKEVCKRILEDNLSNSSSQINQSGSNISIDIKEKTEQMTEVDISEETKIDKSIRIELLNNAKEAMKNIANGNSNPKDLLNIAKGTLENIIKKNPNLPRDLLNKSKEALGIIVEGNSNSKDLLNIAKNALNDIIKGNSIKPKDSLNGARDTSGNLIGENSNKNKDSLKGARDTSGNVIEENSNKNNGMSIKLLDKTRDALDNIIKGNSKNPKELLNSAKDVLVNILKGNPDLPPYLVNKAKDSLKNLVNGKSNPKDLLNIAKEAVKNIVKGNTTGLINGNNFAKKDEGNKYTAKDLLNGLGLNKVNGNKNEENLTDIDSKVPISIRNNDQDENGVDSKVPIPIRNNDQDRNEIKFKFIKQKEEKINCPKIPKSNDIVNPILPNNNKDNKEVEKKIDYNFTIDEHTAYEDDGDYYSHLIKPKLKERSKIFNLFIIILLIL
jgi:hypothetical protein